MEAILKTGKKTIHSDWTLMMAHYENDGTFKLVFADKHSQDQIRLQLEKDDVARLLKMLQPKTNN